ncbi:hypothetical protein B0T25DRAFT_612448 [Lasiosphaeria hispida]|uniref:Uncharacterized protein n=1 Tax=Lasiosphaeria hispida TaxID=260671 RepID=A0AAJ0HB95_9PEZI|nr:hypothetical protein B0T25DRAFT_612448 [Lasiosphaeria hispida]
MADTSIVTAMVVVFEGSCCEMFGVHVKLGLDFILKEFEGAAFSGIHFISPAPNCHQAFVAFLAFPDLSTTVADTNWILQTMKNFGHMGEGFKARNVVLGPEQALLERAKLELIFFINSIENTLLECMLDSADIGGTVVRSGVNFDQLRRVLRIHNYV